MSQIVVSTLHVVGMVCPHLRQVTCLQCRNSLSRARAPFQEKTNHRRTQRTNSSHDEEAGRGRLALTLSLSAPASAASGARLSAYLAPLKESYEKDRDIDRNAI